MPVLWTVTSSKGTLNLEPRYVVCTVSDMVKALKIKIKSQPRISTNWAFNNNQVYEGLAPHSPSVFKLLK